MTPVNLKASWLMVLMAMIPFGSGSGQANKDSAGPADPPQSISEKVAELRKQVTVHSVRDSLIEYKERKIDSVNKLP